MRYLWLKRLIVAGVLLFTFAWLAVWCIAQKPPGPGDAVWQARVRDQGWSRFVKVAGHRFHYLDIGQGRPILLIHGFADSAYTWHHNLDSLARAGFRALAVDLPGIGESPVPSDYPNTVQALGRTLIAFLDDLGLDRVDVIGNSLGGSLSLALAVDYPQRIQRVIVIDPLCYPSIRHTFFAALADSPPLAFLIKPLIGPWVFGIGQRLSFHNPELVNRAMISQRSQPLIRPDFPDHLVRLGRGYISEGFNRLAKQYGRIPHPTLIIWGATDRVIPMIPQARRLQADIPGSRLVIMDRAGHLPHQERPNEFNELVLEFLNRPPRP